MNQNLENANHLINIKFNLYLSIYSFFYVCEFISWIF